LEHFKIAFFIGQKKIKAVEDLDDSASVSEVVTDYCEQPRPNYKDVV
jgi:hypothetical protein